MALAQLLTRCILLLCMGLPGVVPRSAPRAATPDITDRARIFSHDAPAAAQRAIDQIKTRHKKNFEIETFPAIPDDQQDAFKSAGKEAFFDQWAQSRAKATKTNGVYLLICMNPRYLEVEVGNRTQTREFTRSDRDELRARLQQTLRAGQFDRALIEAAEFVRDRMDANVGGGKTNDPTRNGVP